MADVTKQTAKNRRNFKSTQVRDAELRRVFGDMEVVEATEALHIQPRPRDIKTAKRDDPANCAFSRACQRMYDSSVVLFFRTVAYVDLLDEHSVRKIYRFRIDRPAQEFIKAFDAGEDVGPGGFRLSPPPPGMTLNGAAEQRKKRTERRREAALKGEAYEPDPRYRHAGMNRPTAARFRNFRTGAGMVHFPRSVAAQ
jgi:hypothetical protein